MMYRKTIIRQHHFFKGAWSHTSKTLHRLKTTRVQGFSHTCHQHVMDTAETQQVPLSYAAVLQFRSNHINAVSAASCRPLAAVGEVAVIVGGAVHMRRLQFHLAGGDGCVELNLSPVHNVEHQANADDDL